ncbi:hypothetical protein [Agaribacterium sp. ZY112]|uniref:hypothetical protein n=1 Tax=Agaribacterium sp. ZY112 TaxID=3233574 RepID=UPI003525A8FD
MMEVNKHVEPTGGEQAYERKVIKQRGFWLSAFLLLMMLTNPLTALSYFVFPEFMSLLSDNFVVSIVYVMGILALLNTAFAIAMWNWKKLGVYGFYATSAVACVINLYVGLGVFGSLIGLIGPAVVWLTTRSRWQHFS